MNWAVSYVVGPDYLEGDGNSTAEERAVFQSDQDNEHAPLVAVVDDVLARQYFPKQNPVGKRINVDGVDSQVEIVGVVGHVKQWGLESDDTNELQAQLYFPFMQRPNSDAIADGGAGVSVVVRFRS